MEPGQSLEPSVIHQLAVEFAKAEVIHMINSTTRGDLVNRKMITTEFFNAYDEYFMKLQGENQMRDKSYIDAFDDPIKDI